MSGNKYNYIPFLFCLLVTSCELPLDLREIGDEDMLKLECLVTPGDTTVLNLDVLVPVGYHERIPSEVSSDDIIMTIDGKVAELIPAKEGDRGQKSGTFYVVEDIPHGAEVCINASVEGMEPIEARTVVPPSLDGGYMNLELTDITSGEYFGEPVRNIVKGRLELPERLKGCRIGIGYTLRNVVDSCGVKVNEETWASRVYDVKNITSDGNVASGSDFDNLQPLSYGGPYVWKGTDEYEFMFVHAWDSVSEFEDEYGNMHKWSYDYSFRFEIYVFSEECYRYYSRTTSRFFELGLASPSYTYTNVHGGTGLLGAVVVAETPWYDDSSIIPDETMVLEF